MKLTEEKVLELFENDEGVTWEGDNCYQGLQIIAKCTDNVIQGAGHDTLYSENVDTLIEAGMKKEEFEQLRKLNWMIEYNSLACFV